MKELTAQVRGNVKAGTVITFIRKGVALKGIVEFIREASVIVSVDDDVKNILGLDNHLTVVNHANYKVSK